MIKLRKKQKGFTLVELLIVIAIIAVLAAVVTPVALSAIEKSKATAVYAEIKSIETADLTYYVQNSEFAADITELEAELNGISGGASKNASYVLAEVEGKRTLTVTVKSESVGDLIEDMEPGSENFAVVIGE